MNRKVRRYRAYLLRLWQVEEGGPWRASLENTEGGERLGFADMEKLMAFIREETQPSAHDDERRGADTAASTRSI